MPRSIGIIGGNSQSALPGDSLPLPLVVSVTGSDNGPFAGAVVTWTVTSGAAALVQALDTTDANGVSTNVLVLGNVRGNLVIAASSPGIGQATFLATMLDPCVTPINHPVGSTQAGVLTAFDCVAQGIYFTDFYRVVLHGQQAISFTQTATTFDTYLELFHVNGPFMGYNDNIDAGLPSTNRNSRLSVIAATGTYSFAASTFDPGLTGPYEITSATQPASLAGCPTEILSTWITRGVALADQVQNTDCAASRLEGGTAYSDRVLIVLDSARNLTVEMASASFNPRIELYHKPGPFTRTLAAAVNGVGGRAVLTFTAAALGIYRLDLTSADTAQTGPYTMTVAGPAPGEAATVQVVGPGAWRDRRTPERAGKARR